MLEVNKITKLEIKKITSVDLVPEGSCGEAHITLVKSKGGESEMNYESILKSLAPEEAAIITAELEKAKGEMPEGFMSPEEKKKMEDEKAKIEKELTELKKAKEVDNEEEIIKASDLPEATKNIVLSSIAKAKQAEEDVKKMQELYSTQECITKAKSFANIPEADTKLVPILKALDTTPGATDSLMTILKSVDALIGQNVFTEVGTNGDVSKSAPSFASEAEAWAAIEKAAKEVIAKGDTKMTFVEAQNYICTTQPEMYAAYVAAANR